MQFMPGDAEELLKTKYREANHEAALIENTCSFFISLRVSCAQLVYVQIWVPPHTFAWFYKVVVTSQTLAHAVLCVGS